MRGFGFFEWARLKSQHAIGSHLVFCFGFDVGICVLTFNGRWWIFEGTRLKSQHTNLAVLLLFWDRWVYQVLMFKQKVKHGYLYYL